ncbi:hypothetical protein ACFYRN_45595, partial [Streptomyces sp. NPDC005227]|uniref:hypothetical protein n=1 Tax=Streptomyces sp. NPDC005227 TaxID=3364707 RepID=UPI00367E354C
MGHTHSLTEWFAYLSLGLIPVGALMFVLAFADADARYFDPRPALLAARDRLLVEIVRARPVIRDTALAVAALLFLLTA